MSRSPPSEVSSREFSVDVSFSVPFVHRLRATEDVTDADWAVLADLIEVDPGLRTRVLVVAETAVAEAARAVARQVQSHADVESVGLVVCDGGEWVKNDPTEVDRLLSRINVAGLDRRSYVIAIGGGAMLDMAGYAAAIAHRGIRLIRLPTTTLAQADSGVGVKNAINHYGKKNWVGTFAVPWAVINDMSLLATLPHRDFVSGFSEAVKVSLLKDRGQFQWLCENTSSLVRRDVAAVRQAVGHSCRLHLDHITRGGDPFETLTARPLDFGHWSAHRLEPLSGYRIRHGEAVAIGVAIDCRYSALVHGLENDDADRVIDCFNRLGLPLWDAALDPLDRLLDGLEEFRQHLGGQLTVTMLRDVGDPIDVHEIDHEAMRAAIESLRAR